MTINVGDRLPDGKLIEFVDEAREGCSVGPNTFNTAELLKGRKVVIFGLPGAFTPTCSAKHLPGYIEQAEALHGKGVDEIWCLAANDEFVMGAWGREQGAQGKVRMMSDPGAEFSKKLGLDLDMTSRGWGARTRRFSMLVDDGVVKALNVEQGGKFEVSGADRMLEQV